MKMLFDNVRSRPAYDVLGDRYTVLLSAEETGGAYSMFEFSVPPGHGSPPHVHSHEDESFYVVSGELEFMVDGVALGAGAGDLLFGPKGVPHNFTAVGDEPARVICITSPGGFERFFAAVGKLVSDPDSPAAAPTAEDIAKLKDEAPKFGLKLL